MKTYRIYFAVRNEVGGLDALGIGWESVEAETAAQAASQAAESVEDGMVVVATDDAGDSAEVVAGV